MSIICIHVVMGFINCRESTYSGLLLYHSRCDPFNYCGNEDLQPTSMPGDRKKAFELEENIAYGPVQVA